MVQLKLRRYDAPSYKVAFIDFPALESKLDEAMRGIDVGISTEKNCIVEEISGDNGGLQSLVGKRVNADEVQYLAKRMDSFDKNELQTFYAAVHAEKPESVKDLINLTFNTHCYTAVADFSDIAAVGRMYELNRQGCMNMVELEQLDAITLGRMLISSGKGEVTPFGVLYRNGNVPDVVYNGEQFPEYSYRGDEVAMVTLEVGDYGTGISYEYLYLPCWDIEITKALNRLGVADASNCSTHLDCDTMSETVRDIFTADFPLCSHLNTLNELTRSYIGFDRFGLAAFDAIIELANPKTPQDVLVLAQNFYEFSAIPDIKTAEDYGRHIAKQGCELNWNIEKYVDWGQFGEDIIAKENGEFTEWGYIAYRGNTPAVLEILNGNQQSQDMSMKM